MLLLARIRTLRCAVDRLFRGPKRWYTSARARWHALNPSFAENSIEGCFERQLRRLLFVALVVAGCIPWQPAPLPDAIRTLLAFWTYLGVLATLALFCGAILRPSRFVDSFLRVFRFLLAWNFAGRALARHPGAVDPFVTALLAEPKAGALASFGVLLLCACYGVFGRYRRPPLVVVTPTTAQAARLTISPSVLFRHEQSIRNTAAHEAGHALLLAFLTTLPDGVALTVEMTLNAEREYDLAISFGHLAVPHDPGLSSAAYLEWFLLLLLAGAEAEQILLGFRLTGSGQDNLRWAEHALLYLQNGMGPDVYLPPNNYHGRRHNAQTLEALRREQRKILQRFFSANRTVLAALADHLARARTLQAEELKPYLAGVQKTPGMPKQPLTLAPVPSAEEESPAPRA